MIQYWLVKSEPSEWSWHDQCAVATDPWTGVRNYQARNNMKAMKKGDWAFLYHSVTEKRIMGIMEVTREHYPDPEDPRFVLVDFKAVRPLARPVSLETIKNTPALAMLPLIRQSRLSVMPVTEKEWQTILSLGDLAP